MGPDIVKIVLSSEFYPAEMTWRLLMISYEKSTMLQIHQIERDCDVSHWRCWKESRLSLSLSLTNFLAWS